MVSEQPPGTSSGKRDLWSSRSGFILATIGSAAGIGNIWRFSYVAGENGGATFLLVYLVCVLLIGVPIIIAELALGRHSQADAVATFSRAAPGTRWSLVGGLGVVTGFLVLSYYAVIAGWALKYFAGAALGPLWELAGEDYGGYFRSFIASPWEPVLWQALMLGVTVAVVARGVHRGIEAANRLLMPLLAVIVVVMAGYSLSLPGASGGVRFLFAPDWSVLASPDVYLAALGQASFSLGIGMAIFITYGSYLPRTQRIPGATAVIIGSDTMLAVVAGMAIFPAVFAFGMDVRAGPQLAFITLPQVFLAMPAGAVVGLVFFFLLSAAAITSMVSMLEVPVAYFVRRTGAARKFVAPAIGLVTLIIGVPSALGFGVLSHIHINGRGILDSFDYLVSNGLLPAGGLLIAIFVGWYWGRMRALHESDFGESLLGRLWLAAIRYVVPPVVVLMFIRAIGII